MSAGAAGSIMARSALKNGCRLGPAPLTLPVTASRAFARCTHTAGRRHRNPLSGIRLSRYRTVENRGPFTLSPRPITKNVYARHRTRGVQPCNGDPSAWCLHTRPTRARPHGGGQPAPMNCRGAPGFHIRAPGGTLEPAISQMVKTLADGTARVELLAPRACRAIPHPAPASTRAARAARVSARFRRSEAR